eukprot:scaffold4225_cov101-Isochrysis_galbana.AAC.1
MWGQQGPTRQLILPQDAGWQKDRVTADRVCSAVSPLVCSAFSLRFFFCNFRPSDEVAAPVPFAPPVDPTIAENSTEILRFVENSTEILRNGQLKKVLGNGLRRRGGTSQVGASPAARWWRASKWVAMAEEADALCAELLGLTTDQAAAVVTKWLETRGMSRTLASFADECGREDGGVVVAAAGHAGATSVPLAARERPFPASCCPLPAAPAAPAARQEAPQRNHGLPIPPPAKFPHIMRTRPQVASLAALEPPEARGVGGSGHSAAAAAAPAVAPAAEALPVPGTSSRPGKLYDTEALTVQQVPEMLLTKPDPIFHGERDERKRESSQLHDFAMQARAPRPPGAAEPGRGNGRARSHRGSRGRGQRAVHCMGPPCWAPSFRDEGGVW